MLIEYLLTWKSQVGLVIAQPEMLLSNSKHRKTEIIGFGVILISWYADSHSENWPTCQIIDSWSCVEVYCQESDFDHHVNFLQLLCCYRWFLGWLVAWCEECPWHSASGCRFLQIVTACVNYLEATPWEKAEEEEEILKIIPRMGSKAQPILAHFQPVNPSAVRY